MITLVTIFHGDWFKSGGRGKPSASPKIVFRGKVKRILFLVTCPFLNQQLWNIK